MRTRFEKLFTFVNFLKLLSIVILFHQVLDLFFEINLKGELSYSTRMFITGFITGYLTFIIIKFLEDKLRIGVRRAEE